MIQFVLDVRYNTNLSAPGSPGALVPTVGQLRAPGTHPLRFTDNYSTTVNGANRHAPTGKTNTSLRKRTKSLESLF